jgi:hypothetical protein
MRYFSFYKGFTMTQDQTKATGVLHCEAKLCCKATAALKLEVQKDMDCQDRPIGEVLEGQPDEDQNPQG